jgi:prefoldin subunit 5
MPKPAMRISVAHTPEVEELQRENETLQREVATLKAQLATLHTSIRAVLDATDIPPVRGRLPS